MVKEIVPIRVAQIMGKFNGGGVESVVMNYYRHINRNIIQFDFICDNDSTNIPYEEIEKMGGRVILIPPYQDFFNYNKELQKVLKDNGYKIVHSHINTLSAFSLFAAKKAGVPIRIAHAHSVSSPKELKRHILKICLRPFSKMFATHYMSCSISTGKWQFGKRTYNHGDVFLLYNAIELDRFIYNQQTREEYRKSLKINDKTIVIGHLGRFVETKNHAFLLSVFNEINKEQDDSLLLLAGQGPLLDTIQSTAKEMNLDNKILFLGQIENSNELYQCIDAFVLPSLYEGFPVVAVEAQAASLPCVISTTVPKEIAFLNSTTFLNLNQNPEIWADTIIELIKNTKRNNNKSILKEKHMDIETEAKYLEEYYKEKYTGLIRGDDNA